MKLIVGLGNKGEKYKNNRHNVGFMFLDYLAKRETYNAKRFEEDKYLSASILTFHATRNTLHEDLVLAKPQTFMNKSGESVKACVTRYALHVTHDLIVAHDDLDIPFGKFRIVKGYGPKLHNGIESIQNHLQTMDFLRIRIGVDKRSPDNRIPGIDYVLQNFSEEEQEKLGTIFENIINRMKTENLF